MLRVFRGRSSRSALSTDTGVASISNVQKATHARVAWSTKLQAVSLNHSELGATRIMDPSYLQPWHPEGPGKKVSASSRNYRSWSQRSAPGLACCQVCCVPGCAIYGFFARRLSSPSIKTPTSFFSIVTTGSVSVTRM